MANLTIIVQSPPTVHIELTRRDAAGLIAKLALSCRGAEMHPSLGTFEVTAEDGTLLVFSVNRKDEQDG